MQPFTPLSQGNRLQRAYARWAEPYYARMDPQLREQSILIDRFLYSRRGLAFWLGLLAAVVGSSVGLTQIGLPWWVATGAGLLWLALPLMGLAAWLQPALWSGSTIRKVFPRIVLLAALGALSGFVLGHYSRTGSLEPGLLAGRLLDALKILIPAIGLTSGAILLLLWGVAQLRRQLLERELRELRLQHERDAATAQAVQAQLKLLQGQIQPHFIFNTLSAVQHWVDQGDPRAGPLLRALTAFLRGSTELLGREQVSLIEEAALVRHYLNVMSSRLGERLAWSVELDPEVEGLSLPPGLLLTLVENAVEHGVSASLSGGRVGLKARADGEQVEIEVRDSAGLLSPQAVDGVGLRNSRERLRHRFGEVGTLQLGLDGADTVALLRVPLREPAPLPPPCLSA
ncbi:MAG: histidine kinase [Rubrivivax sp.]|nr:histidine kinase [Rubrivivax sp.]